MGPFIYIGVGFALGFVIGGIAMKRTQKNRDRNQNNIVN